ncbi:PEP-CTERM sorting domain-containing protein [Geobacter sp. FeAm09]|uniref:PEP-CTERM sorting domain-containing protein n=1 Tax=Geobacter sp. FeAm09 TaxID=2597769 RepID=UPI0011F027CD|nr:PEP-CTERM sorting domain-containing protein [Geobacter sp. FeAm09]QEM69820.1 PEP-CTERM sorting domain-containing protein [Geobacter sp. FeAm09]
MPTTKNHKPTKAATGYIRWAVIIAVLLASGIFVRSFFKNNDIVARKTPVQVVQEQQIPEPAVEEPASATSEIAGKYYGLCAKNSIHSVKDFRNTVEKDPVLASHFEGFNWQAAHLGQQDSAVWTYVSYRKDDVIRMTSRPVKLPKGDTYITDGTRTVRTFCCNDYVAAPPPNSASADPVERVDSPARRVAPARNVATRTPPTVAFQDEPLPPIDKSLRSFPSSGPQPFVSGGGSDNFKNYSSGKPPNTVTVVPEPSTLLLLLTGVSVVALLRRNATRLGARSKGKGDAGR